MRPIVRYVLAPALAAAGVVVFEIVRTALVGATALGFGGSAAFALAVAGLAGLPLWLGGALAVAVWDAVGAGWRWGRGEAPSPPGSRRAAWVVFGALVLAALVFGTQGATIHFVRAFNQPIYQGLAVGLVAAGIVTGAAALAGPLVGALARGFAALGRRLPPLVDPTRAAGASTWAATVLAAGAFLAPVVRPELHEVDLRPARLALLWVVLLVALVWWGTARWRGRKVWIAGGALAAVFAGGLGWSAVALGRSQGVLLVLGRDTLLAGPVARPVRALGDRDRDGAPGLFGGGDCDDHNPAVRPGVYDAPGDGVDQNCTGEDLSLAKDPLRPPPRPAPRADKPKWNVMLLTVDALRGDMLHTQMPNLERMAAENVEFRNAYSHGAATYWSLPSILESTVPSRLEMGEDQTPVPGARLLTSVLHDAGYLTALYANVTIFFVRGLRQGADVANYDTSYFTVHGEKPGATHLTDGVLTHVRAWKAGTLQPQRDRFYVWAHYYDPHDPYGEIPNFPADGDTDRAHYEANVRYVDSELGRLFDTLKAEGLWDSTLVIVTADHGDEFLDHGHRFHGETLYEELTHVPLVMHIPGVGAKTLDTPIGHMEIAPTLLDLLGIPIPATYLGRSRADEILTGRPAPDQPIFFEVCPDRNYHTHQVGMRLGDFKLIYRLGENYFELYDLANDPGERRNVYDERPDEAAKLRPLLMRYLDHHLYFLAKGKSGAELPPGAPAPGANNKAVSKR
jgi:arylsulfatase A-like enzyme